MRSIETRLVGQRFGLLTVVSRENLVSGGQYRWNCLCECGKQIAVRGGNLKAGNTTSCGCKPGKRTHGHILNRKRTPTYASWMMMKNRCKATSGDNFNLYSGRGITVCERWNDFENFLADMGERPDGTSLDRIDVNGNYEPSNCRWANAKEQARNTRTNRLLHHDGKTLCVSEWSELLGISRPTLGARLRAGWSVEKTLTTKVGAIKK